MLPGPACGPPRHPQRPCVWNLQPRGPEGRSLMGRARAQPLAVPDGPSQMERWPPQGRLSVWALLRPLAGAGTWLKGGGTWTAPLSKTGGPRPRAGGVEARHCPARLSVRDPGHHWMWQLPVNGARFVISEGEGLSLGPETRLQALRSSRGRGFIIVKKGYRKLQT